MSNLALSDLVPRHFASKLLAELSDQRRVWPVEEPVLNWLESLLPSATHFVLPDGGRIFDDDLRGIEAGLRLPFPIVAIEYAATLGSSGPTDSPVIDIPCPKRIAVAIDLSQWDGRPSKDNWRSREIPEFDSGIIVFSCAFSSNWSVLPAAVWFDPRTLIEVSQSDFYSLTDSDQDYRRMVRVTRPMRNYFRTALLRTYRNSQVERSLDDLCRQSGVDKDALLYKDVVDEHRSILELMEALSCSNVGMQTIPAPRHLNAKRLKKKKPPIFEYKILSIDPRDSGSHDISSAGDRASPRIHLRRGHIRRLPSKKVWVNAAVIGSKAQGMIQKDYRVTA